MYDLWLPIKGGVPMRMKKKLRIVCKYLSGILAVVALFGLLGTLGADFLGNISYTQLLIQLLICAFFMTGSVILQWIIR